MQCVLCVYKEPTLGEIFNTSGVFLLQLVETFDQQFKGSKFQQNQPWWEELRKNISENKEKTQVSLPPSSSFSHFLSCSPSKVLYEHSVWKNYDIYTIFSKLCEIIYRNKGKIFGGNLICWMAKMTKKDYWREFNFQLNFSKTIYFSMYTNYTEAFWRTSVFSSYGLNKNSDISMFFINFSIYKIIEILEKYALFKIFKRLCSFLVV